MRTILCYGDSNTWGAPALPLPRYGLDVRWPGVMRTILGTDYWVIEEGLGGRTTVWDDPVEGTWRNGKTYLFPCLRTHAPLDVVIVMLGTNDLKRRFNLSAYDIASGVGTLVEIIQASECGPQDGKPQVLVVCPPPIVAARVPNELDMMFAGGIEKSQQLAAHYQRVAAAHGCAFFDAGSVIVTSPDDGIHFAPEMQQTLGRALADVVRGLVE